jgi:hypothetical protein
VKNTIAKNIGKLGRRVPIEYLLISYSDKCKIDYTFGLSVGLRHGIGFSLLCPHFLVEINLLPLMTNTHSYYLENGE